MKLTGKLIIAGVLATFLLTACENDDNDENGGPGENEIWMQNNIFNPGEISVSEGTTITWINKDQVTHDVTSSDGLFESGNIEAGGTYEYTFDSAGTYDYVCTIHPGMDGTVTVGSSNSDGSNDNNGGTGY